ncbi:MAG: AMP-binding protein [Desulfobacteraceae bacterium]|jgi:2,3-dihydroxybenzoate-AMP ligase/mycobactin salicyl-AMP ligase|nr:AMP-binding protein [Desulfobacteraceae bacterium]
MEKNTGSESNEEKYCRLRWWAGLTFGDILDKAADVYPEKEALVDDVGRFSYGAIRDQADRLAIGLTDLGIAPEDRVLLQLPNWHEYVVAYFALQKIGAVPVILIARYRQYEINHLAKSSGATAWIVAEKFRRTDYLPIIKDVQRENPGLKRIVVCRGATDHGYVRFEDIIDNTTMNGDARQRLEALRPDPATIAHMGPTGGTTGVPKIVPHTHNSFLCKVEYSARASEFNQETSCLVVLPAAHDLPFANGICATIFACGKLVLSDATKPPDIFGMIQQERVNTVILVPTLVYRLLESDVTESYDLSSLNLIYCGGGASSPEMIRGAIDKFQCAYLCGYGGTEGMLVTTRKQDDIDTLCRSIGKPTCCYDHYKVIDDAGSELPPNGVGHLVVKGPSMFTGYHNMAEENAAAFTDDGYFRTGDLAAIDESGYIRLTGRVKDTIKRGGESIFAPEIETLISDHPDVAVVAVIGIPDPEMGERVCAVIQKVPGAPLSFDSVIAYLKSRGASVLQYPEFIHIVDEMPLTPAGKVDKTTLKARIPTELKH